MPPGLWLAQTVSRQILIPPTETGSHVDRDRFAFVAVALLLAVPFGWLDLSDRMPSVQSPINPIFDVFGLRDRLLA